MTKYGRTPWLDEFPKSRIPSYPKQRGALDATVVIVGGGLTGVATAYGLAAAGMTPILLEANRIGRGETASSTGWLAEEPGVPFPAVERALGLRAARRAFQAWRRAALDGASLLRRLNIKCSLGPAPAVTVAITPDQIVRLKKVLKARKDAGLEVSALNARAIRSEVALDAGMALRVRDGATLDPYRACVGLAAAAVARGAQVHEGSPVRRITFTRRDAKVITEGGSIRTRKVVVATGMPTTTLFRSLARHFWFHSKYLVLTEPIPARVRQQLGRRAAVLRDTAVPPHVMRWVGEDRMLIAGADGVAAPIRQRDKVIVQRTGQLMYELSTLYPDVSGTQPAYGWSADYARTDDGLPYIGAHRNFPHQLLAFGGPSESVTGSFLAGRILARQCFGEMDPVDELFGFHR